MNIYDLKIEIIKEDIETLKELCKLHRLLFDKEHFTAHFDEELLRDYFQMLLRKSPFKYKAVSGNEIVGYLIAGINLDNVLAEFSKKHLSRLMYLLIKNPHFIKEKIHDLIGNRLFASQKSNASVRLFLIAAKHNENVKGAGRSLIQYFERDLMKNNISLYGLSVRKHNLKAIEFYIQLGFKEEFRTKKSIYFIKTLK